MLEAPRVLPQFLQATCRAPRAQLLRFAAGNQRGTGPIGVNALGPCRVAHSCSHTPRRGWCCAPSDGHRRQGRTSPRSLWLSPRTSTNGAERAAQAGSASPSDVARRLSGPSCQPARHLARSLPPVRFFATSLVPPSIPPGTPRVPPPIEYPHIYPGVASPSTYGFGHIDFSRLNTMAGKRTPIREPNMQVRTPRSDEEATLSRSCITCTRYARSVFIWGEACAPIPKEDRT